MTLFFHVIANEVKQSRLLQEQLRLPRRFTPRNDIILFCHCERSEAISLKGGVMRA